MSYLIDTNILLRSIQNAHPMHQVAVQAVRILFEQGETLYVAPQNLIEFWVVSTRPITVNGLGFSITEGLYELEQIKNTFVVLTESNQIFPIWENLISQYQVSGKPAHDTRLVAAMIAHNVPRLLTFNIADFKRFSEITAISPHTIT